MNRWLVAPVALPLLLAAPAAAGPDDTLDVRSLPTAVELWRWEGATQSLLVGRELLYVAGKGRVTALDPRDGEVVWSTQIGTEEEDCGCGHGAHVETDERLFVPIADAVAVLDRDDGALVTRVQVGATVHAVEGPPVVAQGDGSDTSILVRFDGQTGAEITRRELPEIYSFERFGDRFTAIYQEELPADASGIGPDEGGQRLVVLGLDDLLQVGWQREAQGWVSVERDGDRLLEVRYDRRGRRERRPIDPATGAIGTPLEEDDDESRWQLDCEAAGADDEALKLPLAMDRESRTVTLERRGPKRWTHTLHGHPTTCLVHEDLLYLRVDRGTTRDLLEVVAAKNGERRHLVYLPAGVDSMFLVGDRLILERRDGLLAIDPLAGGPAEAATQNLAAAVAAILARAAREPSSSIAAELHELGAEALPILTEALPGLAEDALAAVAEVIGQARYRPAAPALAAVLQRLGASPVSITTDAGDPAAGDQTNAIEQAEEQRRWVAAALVRALAGIAGPAEAPALLPYLDRERPESCVPALGALGRLATPTALGAVDRFLAEAAEAPPGSWLVPPTPPARPITDTEARAAYQQADGTEEPDWEQLTVATRALVVAIDGAPHLLFPSFAQGGRGDLWISARDADTGGWATASYLGTITGCDRFAAHVRDGMLHASCAVAEGEEDGDDGGELELEEPAVEDEPEGPEIQPGPPLHVPVGAWLADRDADGLGDLYETHLGLDPKRADTDGDGRADAIDRAPNASHQGREPTDPEGELLLAAFTNLFACFADEGRESLFYIVSPQALEWRGRTGPTITVDSRRVSELGSGWEQVIHLVADDDPPPPQPGWPAFEPLEPGEHRVGIGFGGADGEMPETALALVLRRNGGRWYLTRFDGWGGWH